MEYLLSDKSQARATPGSECLLTSTSLPKLLNFYLVSCKVEGKSPPTLDIYSLSISYFIRFAQANKLPLDVLEVSVHDIRLFLLSCQERNLRPASVHAYYRSLRTFFNWLVSEGVIEISPMSNIKPPKLPKQLIKPFSRQEIDDLLLLCSTGRFMDYRNRAMILLFLDTGLRLAELSNIQLAEVNFDQELIKVMGKGAKERVVRFGKAAQKAVLRYIMERDDGYPCLWVTASRKPMAQRSISEVIVRLCRRAGITRAKRGPHTFRHTFAISYLRNGGDLFTLQCMLGHSTLEMTRRYTSSLGADDMIRVHKMASPVDRMGV